MTSPAGVWRFRWAFIAGIVLLAGCSGTGAPVLTDEAKPGSATSAAVDANSPTEEDALLDPEETLAAAEAPTSIPQIILSSNGVACLTLRQRLGQTLMPLAMQSELGPLGEFARAGEVGGVTILGTSNDLIRSDLEALQAGSLLPLHIGSDEEGGVVQRLANLIEPLPSAQELSTRPTTEVEAIFASYGLRMGELGYTMAFAPVVDVGGGPGIGSRSFSTDPQVVTNYGAAVLRGYKSAGIVAVLKHFPGHGRASDDSHLLLPVTPSLEEMRGLDLIPFAALADEAPAIMVAHLSVPGLSDETPTSLSPATINGLLRGELGYDQLVITDALNMGAITASRTPGQAAVEALAAGADIAMINGISDITPVLDELEQAVNAGILSPDRVDEAALRVLASKGLPQPCVGRVVAGES